jgi:signal transduction histidine kinase
MAGMPRGTWITVAIVLAVAIAVAGLGLLVSRRDRAALVTAFAEEQLARLRYAARETEKDLEDSWRDLEFATRLVDASSSAAERTRELRALLAVESAYHLVAVYGAAGRSELTVLDPLLPDDWSPAPFQEAIDRTARRAVVSRTLAASPLVQGPGSAWYRVLAAPRPRTGGAVALLVDLRDSFRQLQVAAPDRSGRVLVLAPDGGPTPLSPPALGDPAALRELPGLAALAAALRAGETGSSALPARDAATLGLEGGDARVAFAPIRDGPGGRWGVAVVDRADVLRTQERVISLQALSLGATLAVAFTLVGAYLVLNARRVGAVQVRLREAEQLAHLREKSEKILENVPVAVVALDGTDRVSALNREARRTVPASALGAPLDAAFPGAAPETLAALRATIAEAQQTRTVRSTGAQPLALSGLDTFFAVHAVPLEHPLPDVRLLVVLTDLTEQRALTSQLLRAEKLATVGVLAAGIAHEIGTPLAVVRGRAERISGKLAPGHPQVEDARTIVEEIDRIARTLRELLDYSRPSAPRTVPVAFDEVARMVVELLSLEARARGVALRLEIPRQLPPVAADPDQLQQALVNVALNAVHACGRGGTVTVRGALRRDRTLGIEVEDDGAGIPEELRARVFDPFFTTKKRGEGTGLGLTIAAQLVRGHGGDIDLESAVGRGTRVRIGWPLAAADREERHG